MPVAGLIIESRVILQFTFYLFSLPESGCARFNMYRFNPSACPMAPPVYPDSMAMPGPIDTFQGDAEV